MSGCKIPCIDKTQVYIRITPYPWQCWKNMQGNKRVGLGSGWELPDTLRVYSDGSGLLLQWDIARYKLAENDNTPSRHITIFIRGRHIYYGSVWNLFVGFMDIAHASCTHLVIQTYFTRRSRFIVEELGLWSLKISWYTLAIIIASIASIILVVRCRAPKYLYLLSRAFLQQSQNFIYGRSPSIRPIAEQKFNNGPCTPAHAQSTMVLHSDAATDVCTQALHYISFSQSWFFRDV